MKRSLSLAISLLLCYVLAASFLLFPVNAADLSASGTCGAGLTWTLDSEGTLTISGNGRISDYYLSNPWYSSRSSIRKAVIAPGVTGIGDYAFYGCSEMTSVSLPNGIQSIGENAFMDCSSLSSISLPGSVSEIGKFAFQSCTGLSSIVIPQGVSVIPEYAFQNCTNLGSITLPKSVQSVEAYAFRGCNVLSTVNYRGTALMWQQVSVQSHNEPFQSARKNYVLTDDILPAPVLKSVERVGESVLVTWEPVPFAEGYRLLSRTAGETQWKTVTTTQDTSFLVTGLTQGIEYSFTLCCVDGDTPISPCDSKGLSINFYVPAVITEQPTQQNIVIGKKAAFHIAAEGTGLSYQWQVKTPGGNWSSCGFSGTDYTFTPVMDQSGFLYRCLVTDKFGTSLISDEVMLDVYPVLKITEQPKDCYDYRYKDEWYYDTYDFHFSVSAIGKNLAYEWQVYSDYSPAWTTYYPESYYYDGVEYTPTSSENAHSPGKYRCIITDPTGQMVISEPANAILLPCFHFTQDAPIDEEGYYSIYDFGLPGKTVKLVAKADGIDVAYHWQWRTTSTGAGGWSDCPSSIQGYNTNTLTIQTSAATPYCEYRCIATDFLGTTITSGNFIIDVYTSKFTEHPQSITIDDERHVTFRANGDFFVTEALYDEDDVGHDWGFSWEEKSPSSDKWTDCPNSQNRKTLTIFASPSLDGFQYRCKFSTSGMTIYSNPATLTFNLTIINQPTSQTVLPNTEVAFAVYAPAAVRYQWQYRPSATASWTDCVNVNIVGDDMGSIAVIASNETNNYQYRCIVYNRNGKSLTSNIATLHVEGLEITSQPTSQVVAPGQTVTFRLSAKKADRYYWYWRESDSAAWKSCTYSTNGYKTNAISLVANSAMDGYQYYCLIFDIAENYISSNIVTLTIQKPLTITSQPVSQTVELSDTVNFSIAATGAVSYKWQYRSGSTGEWADCAYVTGRNTQQITVTASKTNKNYQYRCIITDSLGNTLASNAAVLYVKELEITSQPTSQTVPLTGTASFKITAIGAAGYQWQYRSTPNGSWTNCSVVSGKNTNQITLAGSATNKNYQYRCVVTDSYGNTLASDPATLTVTVPTIVTQPADQLVNPDSAAAFRVSTLYAAKFQWQWRPSATGEWKDCSSATTGYRSEVLKPVATAARNGYQYRCIVSDSCGNTVTSNPAVLTVNLPLSITSQPANQNISENGTASFTVAASGTGLTYRWQWKSASTEWANCSSATSGYNTANLKPVATAARNGYQYRCIITDAAGKTVTSNAAALSVKIALTITAQPASQSVSEGASASFKVAAAGTGLTYRWQWKSASTEWANCSSATAGYNTATLKPVGTAARNGYQYRCVIKDAAGKTVTSNAATLSVKIALTITAQPASQSVSEGTSASFKVAAAGTGLTYRWQWKSASTEWANCSSATAGYNTANLKPVGTAARNGYQYRCVIKDASGKSVTSSAATLTVKASSAPSITTQPASTTVAEGSTASFLVVASGSGLTYQWQWRAGSNGTWTNCSSATAGYNTASLKPVGTAARNGYQYRCVVKDAAGRTVTSGTATLTVESGPVITTQPASTTVTVGSTASFQVIASGSGLTYQWQWRAGSSGTWANCSSATAGYNTAALKPVGTSARNGYQYRCVVTDANGNSVTSGTATLTVK